MLESRIHDGQGKEALPRLKLALRTQSMTKSTVEINAKFLRRIIDCINLVDHLLLAWKLRVTIFEVNQASNARQVDTEKENN
jgi:hypothetical protein